MYVGVSGGRVCGSRGCYDAFYGLWIACRIGCVCAYGSGLVCARCSGELEFTGSGVAVGGR